MQTGIRSRTMATFLVIPLLTIPVLVSKSAEAKAHYYARLLTNRNQSEEWRNGIQAVNDVQSASIVRIICAEDALPDKQSTLRIFAVNRSNEPVDIGPENVSIELPSGERIPMMSYEELEGRLRRDIKRRKTAAMIGTTLSAMGANGSTSGSVEVSGMTSNGTLFNATGSYTGYDPVLQQQQEDAVGRQAAALAVAIRDRQVAGMSALGGLMRRNTLQPGETFGGIVAYEASPSFKQLKGSTPVTVIVQVGREEHRITATLSQLRDRSRQAGPSTNTRLVTAQLSSAVQRRAVPGVERSSFSQTPMVLASAAPLVPGIKTVAPNAEKIDPYEAGRRAGAAALAAVGGEVAD